jgi:hypothetical protein
MQQRQGTWFITLLSLAAVAAVSEVCRVWDKKPALHKHARGQAQRLAVFIAHHEKRPRLLCARTCRLVCKDWAAAAVLASTHVDVAFRSVEAWKQFQGWMERCGSNLQHLSARPVSQPSRLRCHDWLMSPGNKLSQLVSLRLKHCEVRLPPTATSSSSTAAPPQAPAAAGLLARLQRLELISCNLHLEQFRRLSSISGSLTSLIIDHVSLRRGEAQHDSDFVKAWAGLLASQPELSELQLSRSCSGFRGALSPISSMQQLQRLSLDGCSVPFPLLPPSLTSLELTSCTANDPAAPHLSNLKQLEVLHTRVQASLLHSFPKLRRLVLTSVRLQQAAGHPSSSAAAAVDEDNSSPEALKDALAAIARMSCLQHLELTDQGLHVCPDINRFTALTASSHLTALHMSDQLSMLLPAQALRHVLPAGHQLPQLRVLRLRGSHMPAATAEAAACGDATGICRMAECCPGLQELQLDNVLAEPTAAACLSQLVSLTGLSIAGRVCSDATAAAVAQLTGLRSLCWEHAYYYAVAPGTVSGLQQLTALQGLTYLQLKNCKYCTGRDSKTLKAEPYVSAHPRQGFALLPLSALRLLNVCTRSWFAC